MNGVLSSLAHTIGRLPQRMLMGAVRAYRFFLSPWLGNACRFEPTCSAYSLQALQQHGALVGSYLTLHRLARCHPWCAGGHDPVPAKAGLLFTRLLSRRHESAPPLAATRLTTSDKKIRP